MRRIISQVLNVSVLSLGFIALSANFTPSAFADNHDKAGHMNCEKCEGKSECKECKTGDCKDCEKGVCEKCKKDCKDGECKHEHKGHKHDEKKAEVKAEKK